MAPKAKSKTVFYCKECGYESAKWMGQCPACKTWNTFAEHEVSTSAVKRSGGVGAGHEVAEPKALSEVSLSEEDRVCTGIGELDRVLGGGIVPGSMILVGGDPGIGKSTLLLQACRELSERGQSVLYISGEESLKQIRMRADRIGQFGEGIKLLCETNLTDIGGILKKEKPNVVIIDSIQTMYNEDVAGTPGSVSQVRESTAVLLQLSKTLDPANAVSGTEPGADPRRYSQGDGHHLLYCGPCDQGRHGSRSEDLRAYGGYGVVF